MHLNIHTTLVKLSCLHKIRTTHVKVTTVDLEIAAYLAAPAGEVLTQPLWCCRKFLGQRPHPEVTERIAKEGYVAIAPALFQRFGF